MPERLAFAASRMPNIGSLAEREGAHPPGGNFLLVQKVTKNTLRGFAPKNPGFWEQGRGGVYIRNDIGSRITYEPQRFRNYACRPVKR